MSQKNLEVLLSQSNAPLRQRRQRTNFNEEAIQSLEEAFINNPYPDINDRERMALQLKTSEDRIQVWFQNKRARYRKKMQKENVKFPKTTQKKDMIISKKSTQVNNSIDLSPIRTADEKYKESICLTNSTPVSTCTPSHNNFKFNEKRICDDSGYISQHSFSYYASHAFDQFTPNLSRYMYIASNGYIPVNSSTPSYSSNFTLSPLANSNLYMNDSFDYCTKRETVDQFKTEINNQKPRSAKSIFRPF